jgi:hypothetical protein
MNKEKQRIAIAEACGWKGPYSDLRWLKLQNGLRSENRETLRKLCGRTPCGEREELPDYLNDLNAMHGAEQILWRMDWSHRYAFNDHLANTIRGRTVNRNEWNAETLLDATAAQRAEAFLRTINKWEKL